MSTYVYDNVLGYEVCTAPWNDCIGKCYARYVIKGEKDIKKNHDYTILRQVFDMAKEGGDDWVEDRFYKGKKIE